MAAIAILNLIARFCCSNIVRYNVLLFQSVQLIYDDKRFREAL